MNVMKTEQHNSWIEYTLDNENITISFLDYGGIITKMMVPDRNGTIENIVLGYEDIEMYDNNPNFFGAIIGRVAGRIEDASFLLHKDMYELEQNEGNHHLHGGNDGFHQVHWSGEPFQTEDEVGVRLHHTSKAGTNGYPGEVDVTITYTLTKENSFIIQYDAISSSDTPLALTNHSYFNLTGDAAHNVGDHIVHMQAKKFLELDEDLIPTGKWIDVEQTAFDFREGRKLSTGFHSTKKENVIVGNGYDHYFLLDETKNTIQVTEPTSKRTVYITTTEPGLMMYTANGLEENIPLHGGPSTKYGGVCFETQTHPASLTHHHLPSVIIKAHEPYHSKTEFTFSW